MAKQRFDAFRGSLRHGEEIVKVGPSYEMFITEGGFNHRTTYPEGRTEEWFEPRATTPCRVYWGSHGCNLERGHEGPHLCSCADNEGVDPVTREYMDDRDCINVGAPPYYGPNTKFYGEDAEALGLPMHPDEKEDG